MNAQTEPDRDHRTVEMSDDRCLSDLEQIAEPLEKLSAKSVFLVADPDAYRCSGAEERLAPILESYSVRVFDEFEPNPKFADVQKGLERFRQNPADVVLAVGGGTAIDVAKLIATLSPQAADAQSLILRQEPFLQPAVPLIAIPTTSGTGSEATQFAVVYLDGVKYSVDHPSLLPQCCVLNPKLTEKLPAQITAQSGLDAFCQAVESLWSVRSTPSSAEYATEAAQLALAHLPAAVHAPTPDSRAAMCLSSHLAGRAINLTRTTASHAISYALTSDYGIPHGHAVALTLGPMLVHNAGLTEQDNNDPRGVAHVQQMMAHILELLECTSPEDACRRIQQFVHSVGCKTRLSELGLSDHENLRAIACKVNTERLNNNPRRLTGEQLVRLLQSVL